HPSASVSTLVVSVHAYQFPTRRSSDLLPIDTLVLATNENNVLDEFFRSGKYEPRSAANTLATSSPSMDISKASNLERFIYLVLDQDQEQLAEAWRQLDATGALDLSDHQPRFLA